MVAYVPTHGVRTIYGAVGDLFAWLCLLGLLAFIGLAITRRRRLPPTADVTVSQREPQPVK
jgi:apolipoprotein N-acyltransferase